MIELRYVYDCERVDNILEYREVVDNKPITAWKRVPFVYQIGVNDYKDPSEITEQDLADEA